MPDLEEYRRLILEAMSELTERAADGTGAEAVLASVTRAAVALIRGAVCADVMLVDGRRFQSLAPTAPCTAELGAVQIRHGRGPCLEAAVDDVVIRSPDLAADQRWPDFARCAIAAGLRSVLTYQLHTTAHDAGALNIYGGAAGAFNVEDEAIGATLAVHASSMLAAEANAARHETVLADCETVGRATGVLMERFHLDARHAYELLDDRARACGTSVPSIAREIACERD